jgi:hypothetical protein
VPLAELFSSFIVSLLPSNYRSTLAQPLQHTLLRVVPKVLAPHAVFFSSV